jgi:hypothetical protein
MTAETYHFDKGTKMPFKTQWREARRRLAEIAEKYDLDEHSLPRRGTW